MTVSAASALAVTGTDTDARDYTTASWTPTVGKVYSVAVAWLDLGSAKTSPTISGNNITWVAHAANETGGTATQPSIKVWIGYADSSATAGSITFSGLVSSGQTADGAMWGIAELSGTTQNATSTHVQGTATTTANDTITSTLGAFSSVNNATASWIVSYDDASTTGPAITAGAGFAITTNLNASQAMGGDGVRLAFQFRNDNDTSVTASAAAANDRMLQVAMELRDLVTGSASGTIAGDGQIAGSGFKTVSRTGSIAGDGAISAAGFPTRVRSGSVAGDGQIAASGVRIAERQGSIAGSGTINSTGLRTAIGSVTIVGDGTISGTGEGPTPPPAPTTVTALTGVGSHRLWQRSRSITLT